MSAFHDRGDLRRDYEYCATLAQRKGLPPLPSGRNKWKTLMDNLEVGQLVLVGDAEDQTKRGAYDLERIHCVHPENRKGHEIVRPATVAVLARNPDTGSCEIKYILRDLSKIAPV